MKAGQNVKIMLIVISGAILLAFVFYSSCLLTRGNRSPSGARSAPAGKVEILDKSHLDVHEGIPVLHVYGDPGQIGRQYGTLMKNFMVSMVGTVKLFIPGEELNEIIANAKILEKNLPDHYRTELNAIAEATGIPYIELVAINVIPELRCSCLAVWGDACRDRKLIMGRNLDYDISLLSSCAGLITVYHFGEGKIVVSIGFIGMVGAFTGINSEGLAFGNMLVFNASGEEYDDNGVSIQLLLRDAGQSSATSDQFVEYLSSRKHVPPMNVMIADKIQAKVMEIGLQNIQTIDSGDSLFLASSNHFTSEILRSRMENCPRKEKYNDAVKAGWGEFDVLAMEKALYESRIDGINLQAVVFEPEKMLMHVSLNSNCASKGPYVCFDLKKLFEDSGNPVVKQSP